jgi:hypothetical protein
VVFTIFKFKHAGNFKRMRKQLIQILFLLISIPPLSAQVIQEPDIAQAQSISLGWADEAVSIGYVTAPSVLGLMFISTLVGEWNQGYFGIPASAMIIASAPLIFLGGRSVSIPRDIFQSRAKMGWTLYALSIVPTGFALYGFTTDWGSTLPLTIASGILGTASIVAMTTYAFGRAETGREMIKESKTSLNFGIIPIRGGAMASFALRF